MKISRILMPLFSLMSISISTIGQSISPSTFPKVVPPSPEAQSFMRYGEIPVDYSTGVPQIELPIYQIKSGKLSLPVSLTYHASGIRVSDVASVAGLGWKLSAGGVLTRTVMGLADDDGYGILNLPYLTKSQIDNAAHSQQTADKLNYTSKGIYDAESDRYFYSAGNSLSGDFLYDNNLNLVQTNASDNKITKLSTTSFQVTGSDGTRYIFDKCEYTQLDLNTPYISSWWLTKIISADNTDTIAFEYETQILSSVQYNQSQSVTLMNPPPTDPIVFSASQTTTYPVLLKKITFNLGYITFGYLTDRKDLQPGRLSVISIFNNKNVLINKYQLQQSYFYSGQVDDKYNYRLKLDQVDVYDGNNQYIHNYSFEYDQAHTLPPYIKEPNYSNTLDKTIPYGIDFFGYYNGYMYNQHLIPNLPAGYATINRESNFEYAKTGTLTKINYPTGGFSSFEYQLNAPLSSGVNTTTGAGLRIHKITSKADVNAAPVTRRYEYGNNMVADGLDIFGWNHYSFSPMVYSTPCSYSNWVIANYTMYLSSPIFPFASFKGAHALYSAVEEYMDGGTNNSLKTTYSYSTENDIMISVSSPRYDNQYYIERPWRKGLLAGTHYYKLTSSPPANPTYSLIKSVSYTYSDYRVNTVICGTKIQRGRETWCGPCSFPHCNDFNYDPQYPYSAFFYYFDTQVEVGIKKLTSESVTEYDGNGNSVITTTNTSYSSPNHLFPTNVSITNSKGETQATILKYPHDYTGAPIYDAMVTKNMIAPVIEQAVFKNSTDFLQSSKTNYNFWYNNTWGTNNSNSLIVPQTVESKTLTNATEVRLRYHAYDINGNFLSIAKENDARTSYIWDYNKVYPVAEVKNAVNDQIACASFESDGTGNWNYTGTPSSSVAALSGKKAYNLNGSNNITKTGLNSSTAYIVSYWTKNANAFYIQGTQAGYPVGGRTVNGWKYYEHKITGQTQVSIVELGWIDELRLYPANAQMTSYTYEPLIGITSQCDANSRILYYEYDAFNRLVLVRDQDRNIVKRICYNYSGQAENCNYFNNVAKSGNFTRNNCGSGYAGSIVNYVVPAGTYSSTVSQAAADQLAQDDVNANGQAYANANGSCTSTEAYIYLYNFTSMGFAATFSNTSTNTSYPFNIYPNQGNSSYGPIPPGTYNVTITPLSGSNLYEWWVANNYMAGYNAVNLNGIQISGNADIQINDY